MFNSLFRSRRRQPRRYFRPLVEGLEDRRLMAADLSTALLDSIVQVSGSSTFAADCMDPAMPSDFAIDSEVIPLVAVDPANHDHIVSLWAQDEWNHNGAARGLVAGVSYDGGSNWQPVVVPGLTQCSGGTYQRTTDPRMAFGPDGAVYVVVISGTPEGRFVGDDAILFSKSSDGGLTWTAPVALTDNEDHGHFNHHAFVTPDPTDPDLVYVVWTHETGAKLRTVFTRSTDGGQTFESFRTINDRPADKREAVDQLFIQPDGTLVDVFVEFNGRESLLSAIRSVDGGETWSKPERGPVINAVALKDPETSQGIWSLTRHGHSAEFAMDPHSGAIYAVWEDSSFGAGDHNDVAFSFSTDAGRHWSAPVQVNQTPDNLPAGNRQAFLPTVAVAADGAVAVTYYDFRFNDDAAGLPTDYWFVYADPLAGLTNPVAWEPELRLTDASFNLEEAPKRGGLLFLGIYGGMASADNDFLPVWSMPHADDPASIFIRRVERAPADLQVSAPAEFAAFQPFFAQGTGTITRLHQNHRTLVATGSENCLGDWTLDLNIKLNGDGTSTARGILDFGGGNEITIELETRTTLFPDGGRGQIGTFTIKGGKARFKDATGEGMFTAEVTGTSPETLAISLDGIILL